MFKQYQHFLLFFLYKRAVPLALGCCRCCCCCSRCGCVIVVVAAVVVVDVAGVDFYCCWEPNWNNILPPSFRQNRVLIRTYENSE